MNGTGSSVFFTVIKGKKRFFQLKPTENAIRGTKYYRHNA